MKRLFISLAFLIFCFACKAQIAPPKQTDTLIIHAVKYNYADIYRENWPCVAIYKSTTSFRIGDSEFPIISTCKFGKEVIFTVTEDEGKAQYELVYNENHPDEIVIEFSGYEFVCHKRNLMIDEPAEGEINSVLSYTLDSRKASHLPIPGYGCQGVGDVTVIITVDPQGNVTNAKVMDEISSSDQCLRNFAVRCARLSKFSKSATAPARQTGEITYRFANSVYTLSSAEPNAKLSGRTVDGTLPKPTYGVAADGVVVVDIWVDNYGTVTKALAGAEGTTVTDKTLWQEARKAAMKAHFNMSADAPALQKGTITYTFKIVSDKE